MDLACENFEKSEALTKEVVQAAASKDAFVSSLFYMKSEPFKCLEWKY